jgi:8-oxo-dGTP pyrophosphatase MutT (NUDIX family)
LLEEKDVSPSKWFPLFLHKVKLPDGRIIDDYYISKLGDVAMIVAITKNKEIVFVRQYKHGADDFLLELPAGRIGKKTPEEGAKAELEEEAGIKVDKLESLGWLYHTSSKDPIKIYGFIVTGVSINTQQKFDETEDIELVLVPVGEIEEMIKNKELNGSDTHAFLYIAKLKYPELFV